MVSFDQYFKRGVSPSDVNKMRQARIKLEREAGLARQAKSEQVRIERARAVIGPSKAQRILGGISREIGMIGRYVNKSQARQPQRKGSRAQPRARAQPGQRYGGYNW